MRCVKRLLAAFVPVLVLAACTAGLSDEDRAMLTSANQNADAAKQQSAQALQAAHAAQQQASAAAADAKATSEKADQMFQRAQRK